jgi:hypothetical protein
MDPAIKSRGDLKREKTFETGCSVVANLRAGAHDSQKMKPQSPIS